MSDHGSTWQPAHPSARTSRSAPTATNSGALVTHRVVIDSGEPGLSDLARGTDSETDSEDRQEGLLGQALSGLRFVSESPGSLRDQIEYARDGAYSLRTDGPWRTANIWFARLVAVPGLALCYLLGWALFTRFSRALTAWPILIVVMWLLNAVPVVQWLIPEWADVTTWIPGTGSPHTPEGGE